MGKFYEIDWLGSSLSFEIIDTRADSVIIVKYGNTSVLCAVSLSTSSGASSFFNVQYQKRNSAIGRIPGNFARREKGSEKEILISRLIDRSLRSSICPLSLDDILHNTLNKHNISDAVLDLNRQLFDSTLEAYFGLQNNTISLSRDSNITVHLTCTLFNYDGIHDPVIPAMLGASVAIICSNINTKDHIASIRLGITEQKNGLCLANTQPEQCDLFNHDKYINAAHTDITDKYCQIMPKKNGELGSIIASYTKNGLVMIDADVKELSNYQLMECLKYGHNALEPVFALLDNIYNDIHKTRPVSMYRGNNAILDGTTNSLEGYEKQIAEYIGYSKYINLDDKTKNIISKYYYIISTNINNFTTRDHQYILSWLKSNINVVDKNDTISNIIDSILYAVVRSTILDKNTRTCGRKQDQTRDITIDATIFPDTHSSVSFRRGDTWVVTSTTIDSYQSAQKVEEIDYEYEERFIVHYNFPGYSVNEASKSGLPGRREIGHGCLIYNAIHRLLPNDLCYTIRSLIEVLSSDGSSSMAGVCATSIALSNIGIDCQVAGIAMGLVHDISTGRYVILTDLDAYEDAYGDMDCKVAASTNGITAIQLDIKCRYLDFTLVEEILNQSRLAINNILIIMNPHTNIQNPDKPQATKISINKDKIRDIVGPGGSNIKQIEKISKSIININNEDGTATIFARNNKDFQSASNMIKSSMLGLELNKQYIARVKKVFDFGISISVERHEGFIHANQVTLLENSKLEDSFKIGQELQVQLLRTDTKGRLQFTIC